MSKGIAMTEADKLLLENFFADGLPPEERAALESRVESDAAFAAAFRERQRMEDYLAYRAGGGATPELLARLGREAFAEGGATDAPPAAAPVRQLPRRRLLTLLAAAAAVALLLVAGWWFLTDRGPGDPQELYAAYAEPYPLAGTTMGAAADSLRARFEPLYNAGDYAAALPALSAYLDERPSDGEVRLARGHARLETGDIAGAEADFQLLANGTTAFRDEGQWWYALAALKAGDPAAARERLQAIPANSSRYGVAGEVLGDL
jgi:hypothetical protein